MDRAANRKIKITESTLDSIEFANLTKKQEQSEQNSQ
jgi:hypothetical protein